MKQYFQYLILDINISVSNRNHRLFYPELWIGLPPSPVVFNAAVHPYAIPPVQLVPDHAGEVTVIVAVVPPVTGAPLDRFWLEGWDPLLIVDEGWFSPTGASYNTNKFIIFWHF